MAFDSSFSYPQILNFNSKDRVAGTNSNFISLPIDIGLNKYDSVCLIQASIPKSYYNFPINYNQFELIENSDTITITIPVGSYNKINLASKLSSIMTVSSTKNISYLVTNCLPLEPDTFHFTFTATLDPLTPITSLKLNFDDTSPFRQLGFEPNTLYSFTTVGLEMILESHNAINLSFILRAYIKSDIVQNSNDSILEEILSIGSFPTSSLVFYQQLDFNYNTREYNTSGYNSWTFTLVDGYDNEIDLNGISWSFSLVLFQRNKIHEFHKNELQIQNEERIFKLDTVQQQLKTTLPFLNVADGQIFPVKPISIGLSYLDENEIKYPLK